MINNWLFGRRPKSAVRTQTADSPPPRLERAPAAAPTYQQFERLSPSSMNRAAEHGEDVLLSRPVKESIAHNFYPHVAPLVGEYQSIETAIANGDPASADTQRRRHELHAELATRVLRFLSHMEPRVAVHATRLGKLESLQDECGETSKLISTLYVECAANAAFNPLPVLRQRIHSLERNAKSLLPSHKCRDLSSLLSLGLAQGALKILAIVENELTVVSDDIKHERRNTLAAAGTFTDEALDFCCKLQKQDELVRRTAELATEWHNRYGHIYREGSSEVWAAEGKRKLRALQIEDSLAATSAAFELYSNAVDLESKAAELSGDSSRTVSSLVDECERAMAVGQLTRALVHAKAALHREPSNPLHHILQGRIYERSGLSVFAYYSYRNAIVERPNEAASYDRLQRLVSERAVAADLARADLCSLREHNLGFFELDYNIAQLEIALGRPDAARRIIHEIERSPHHSGDIKLLRAEISLREGNVPGAKELLQAAISDTYSYQPRLAQACKLLAEILERSPRSERVQAQEVYKQAIAANPQDMSLFEGLARVGLPGPLHLGTLKPIAEKYQSCAGFLALGQTYRRFKQPERAMSCFERARDLSPADVEPHLQLADIYHERGDHQSEFRARMTALRLKPGRRDLEDKLIEMLHQIPELASLLPVSEAPPRILQETKEPNEQTEFACETPPSDTSDTLEQSALPARKGYLPQMLVARFAFEPDRIQALRAYDSSIRKASTPAEAEEHKRNLAAFVRSALIEEIPGLTSVFAIAEQGSVANISYREALRDANHILKSAEVWLEGIRNSSPRDMDAAFRRTWASFTQKIHHAMSPHGATGLAHFRSLLSAASEAARHVQPSSELFSRIPALQESLEHAHGEACNSWLKLRTYFESTNPIVPQKLLREGENLLAHLQDCERILAADYLAVSKNIVRGVDGWIADGSEMLRELCHDSFPEAAPQEEIGELNLPSSDTGVRAEDRAHDPSKPSDVPKADPEPPPEYDNPTSQYPQRERRAAM